MMKGCMAIIDTIGRLIERVVQTPSIVVIQPV